MMTARFRARSTITTTGVMLCTPFPASNTDPTRNLARRRSTAGPKTRLGRPPKAKARRSRPTCVHTDSVSIERITSTPTHHLFLPNHDWLPYQRRKIHHDHVSAHLLQVSVTTPDARLAGGAVRHADADRERAGGRPR